MRAESEGEGVEEHLIAYLHAIKFRSDELSFVNCQI